MSSSIKQTKQVQVHPVITSPSSTTISSSLPSSTLSTLSLPSTTTGKGTTTISSSTTSTTTTIPGKINIDPNANYHPYIDEIELGSVYNKIDSMVKDNEEDYLFMKIKVPFTYCSWISTCLGIFLVFFGGGYSIAFQSVKRRFWLEVIGFVLCVPIILWFLYMFCASKEERKRRRVMSSKRKVRLEVYVKNPEILKDEAKERVKQRVEKEVKDREEEEKAIQLEKKLNPLNYPNKNVVTRHKLQI